MQIDEDFLQAPRIQQLREKVAAAESETDKRKFLAMLAREIIKAINNTAMARHGDTVNVNNFDEITASLRNELARANKPLMNLIGQLNLTAQQQSQLMMDIENKSESDFKSQYQPVIIKRPRDVVRIDNFDECPVIEDVSVNNLFELEKYFDGLAEAIKDSLNINLPEPKVTVNPPAINIPETQVNIPPIDLSPLLNALGEVDKSLKLLKNNNKSNPLAVRLTDGGEWIKEVKKQTAQTTQFLSDVSYIKNFAGQRINPATEESVSAPTTIADNSKTVTTAGTRVQLVSSSTPCRYVIVVALATNTDTIWVGGSTVAAGRGRPLVSLQAEKIDINDVSKVYIDSAVNGEGVSFVYVN